MEIERKFLIPTLSFSLNAYPHTKIEQGYISIDPVIRIRKDNQAFFLTVKSKGFLSREELNLPIEESSYQTLLPKAEGRIIQKTRYRIPYQTFQIELDVFEEELSPLILAEVEFTSIEEAQTFLPPSWFGKEVTTLKEYQNSFLSQASTLPFHT